MWKGDERMEISDGMDIASYAMTMSSVSTQSKVSMAVLDKTLEQQQQMGAELTKMMELSVNPSLGGNFDATI